ncbi:MAG: hypothetical protein ACYTHM_05160 [Planctomycetota bacterium]|jgi:hypothetical protein
MMMHFRIGAGMMACAFILLMAAGGTGTVLAESDEGWWGESEKEEEGFKPEFPPDPEEGDLAPRARPKGKPAGISLELEAMLAIPVSGMAGAGNDAPSYAEAFGVGGGANVKGAFSISRMVAARLDLGGMVLPGRNFDSLGTDNLFSDLQILHFLLGADLFLPIHTGKDRWFRFGEGDTFTGFAARLSVHGGGQYVGGVKWIEPKPSLSYWEPSLRMAGGFSVAGEYRHASSVGFSIGFTTLYSGSSISADSSGERAEAGGMLALCLFLGGSVRF